jgi:hypothetical protein
MTGSSEALRRRVLALLAGVPILLTIPAVGQAEVPSGPPMVVVLPAAQDSVSPPPPEAGDGHCPPAGGRPRGRDFRGLAVFGVVAGLQTAATSAGLFLSIEADGMSDATVETTYGLMLGLMPLVDASFGYLVARGSRAFRPSFGTIAAGAYAGAALAFAGVLLSMELDDPKVDGKYDSDDYFGNETHPGILTLMILPVFLPAIGAAIGYRLGRRPRNENGDDHRGCRTGSLTPTVSLPAPRFFRSASGSSPIPGVGLSIRF